MNSNQAVTPGFNKVEYILDSLTRGANRNNLAIELGYTNPKSLDIYMRRKGFLFDSSKINYVPVKTAEINESKTFNTGKRLSTILSLFTNEDADPKRIAEMTGFDNHIELAEFMKKNSFAWNDNFGNYTRITKDENNSPDNIDTLTIDSSEFFIYLPLLRKLYEHKDNLYALINPQSDHSHSIDFKVDNSPNSIQISLSKPLTALINDHLVKNNLDLNKFLELAAMQYLNTHTTR